VILKKIETVNYNVFQVSDKPVTALFDRGQWWFNAGRLLVALAFGPKTRTSSLTVHVLSEEAALFTVLGEVSSVWISEAGLHRYRDKLGRKRAATVDLLLELVANRNQTRVPPVRLALIIEEGLIQGIRCETAQRVEVALVDYDTAGSPQSALKVDPQGDRLCKLGLAHAAHDSDYVAEAFCRLDEKRTESPTETDESDRNAEPTPGAQEASASDESNKTVPKADEPEDACLSKLRATNDETFALLNKRKPSSDHVESDSKLVAESDGKSDRLFGDSEWRDLSPVPPLECTPQTAAWREQLAVRVSQARQAGEQSARNKFYDAATGVLATLVETDQKVAQSALLSFVECNKALAANPHVGVYRLPGNGTAITAMAILNSILMKAGIPAFAPVFTDGVLTGFILASSNPPEALSRITEVRPDPPPRFPAQGAELAYRPSGRIL